MDESSTFHITNHFFFASGALFFHYSLHCFRRQKKLHSDASTLFLFNSRAFPENAGWKHAHKREMVVRIADLIFRSKKKLRKN